MKYTPWLLVSEHKPLRLGVYEVKFCAGKRYSKWNGVHWTLACESMNTAALQTIESTLVYSKHAEWRGITAAS